MVYRLIDPGSEWRLHRQWFDARSIADLRGEDDPRQFGYGRDKRGGERRAGPVVKSRD